MSTNTKNNRISIKSVGILFTISMLILFILGSRIQNYFFKDFKLFGNNSYLIGLLITEFILVLLPVIVYLKITNQNFKEELRLNTFSISEFFLISVITGIAMLLVNMINVLYLFSIYKFLPHIEIPNLPTPSSISDVMISVLVIGGSAAICEEILFRGAILKGLEKLGITYAILISAFLFSIMHMDITKLLGTFLLGVLIAVIVYRTNSIFAGMLAHFINNSVAVIIYFIAQNSIKLNTPTTEQMFKRSSNEIISICLAIVIFSGILGGMMFLFFYITQNKHSLQKDSSDNFINKDELNLTDSIIYTEEISKIKDQKIYGVQYFILGIIIPFIIFLYQIIVYSGNKNTYLKNFLSMIMGK